MMSSEESLNSDNDYKNNNNNNKNKMKQRKPDMQVYVPRAKRIEDQVKQRMSAESQVGDSNTAVGDGKFRFSSSPSPEQRSDKGVGPREFRPTWEDNEEPAPKESARSSDGCSKSSAKVPIRNTIQRKGPPPQPQANKHPSQIIQEMMKRHNITMDGVEGDPKPALSTEQEDMSAAESMSEKEEELLIQFKESTPVDETKVEGDSSILECLPASYQDFIKEEIAFTTATANQRMASVQSAATVEVGQAASLISSSPTSSSTPDMTQQLPTCSGGRSSPCFDADDLEVKMINESFEEAQKQMQLLGSEAVKKAWNPYYAQPNPVMDTTMPMAAIGSSLSKSRKSSANDVTTNVQAPSTTSATGMSNMRTSADSVTEPVIPLAPMKPVRTPSAAKNVSGDSSSGGDGGKLTWAGWGSAVGEVKPDVLAGAKTKSLKKDSDYSTSLFSTTAAIPSTIPIGARGDLEASKPLIPSVPSYHSTSPAITASSLPLCQRSSEENENKSPATAEAAQMDFGDTKEMDMLSAAMIEKVLSEDGDDFESAHGGAKLMQENIGSDSLVRKEKASAKSSSNSLMGDKNLADIWNRDENVDISATGDSASAVAADSWEDLLEEPGDKLIAQLMQQVKVAPQAEKPERKEIDYFTIQPREVESDDEELGHVVEAYGFPPSVKGDDLYLALRQLRCPEFRIEWVDDAHALVVFANTMAAQEACNGTHPVIKLRSMSKASTASKNKAKKMKDRLLPYMKRPDTSAFLARRMVEGHLGKRSEVGADQRKRERERLQEARDQKKVAAQQRTDIWEGRL